MSCLFLFFNFQNFYLFIFRKRGRRKRGREISVCCCLLCAPYRGPGLQPRHVPWLGIELATLWFAACAQSTELHQAGLKYLFLVVIFRRCHGEVLILVLFSLSHHPLHCRLWTPAPQPMASLPSVLSSVWDAGSAFDKHAYPLLTVLIKIFYHHFLSTVTVEALFDIEMLDFMDFEIFFPCLFWQVFEHRLQKIDMWEMNLQTPS